MANCYICGRSPAEYRRTVTTGTSYRMSHSSRGTNWNSTSVRQGTRSVCAECAFKIDYNNKKGGGIFLSIFLGGILLIPGILYIAGINFLHLSSAQMGGLTFTGIAICIVGCIISCTKANKWKEENESKYLGTTSNVVYKSDELGISDLDKSIELCKKIDSEDKKYANFQLKSGDKIISLFDKSKTLLSDSSYDYLNILDDIAVLKNEICDSHSNFSSLLENASNEFAKITTTEAFSKYQNGIEETLKSRKYVYDTQIDTLDKYTVALFQTEIDKLTLDLKNYVASTEQNYPTDTVEQCDEVLIIIKEIEQNIENYSNLAAKKQEDFVNRLKSKSAPEMTNENIFEMVEQSKLQFIDKTKNVIGQCQSIENQVLQEKIKLLQNNA